ncbi:hypothetical protein NL526_28290, partial [Klebsiella pneumoniae]|nr:hypothetical protein [Klebsiella pneumoniae]
HNHFTVNNTTNDTVSQSSDVYVATSQSSKGSTGKNSASKNTGGTTEVTTGDASSKNKVKTLVLPNVNVQPNSCGCNGTTTITDSNNGA